MLDIEIIHLYAMSMLKRSEEGSNELFQALGTPDNPGNFLYRLSWDAERLIAKTQKIDLFRRLLNATEMAKQGKTTETGRCPVESYLEQLHQEVISRASSTACSTNQIDNLIGRSRLQITAECLSDLRDVIRFGILPVE